MTARIALATYDQAPQLASDDRAIVPALAALRAHGEPTVWSDPAISWSQFDAVVVRSCWDYHLRIEEFAAWLDRLESLGVRVLNSPSLLRWNANKRYLLALADAGVATIPTTIIPRGRGGDVAPLVASNGWSRFVLKPAISASGYETHAFDTPLDAAARSVVEQVTALGDMLVQPFAAEVSSRGELSLVFINGVFSHAALKRAAPGEFRVQTEHGGRVDATEVDQALIGSARQVLAALPDTPLYARVDGILRDDAFLLMELELIEPNLFFDCRPGSVDEFARAVLARLG